MNISVFGLGYVGIVSAACFAKLGNKVIGVDVIDDKINAVNKGKAPIKEKSLDPLVKEQFMKHRLSATDNSEEAILNSDISFICVGTPPKRNGDIDLKALSGVCKEIGLALRKKEYHLVVIRSTMFPGSLNILKKIIEDNSGKTEGEGFDMAANPEFLREGCALKDFFNPPYVVVGADKLSVGRKVMRAYDGVSTKKLIVKTNVAQMIKYASNSWHGVKVAFANEVGSVCNELGIDSKKLMNLFCEDDQLNISKYYMKPGFAYGGSCLPKDLAALQKRSNRLGLKVPLIDSVSQSNLRHIDRATELIKSKNKKKIGFLGITFKADTDDIRGNPALLIINNLLRSKYDIKIYDPLISEDNLKPIKKSYRKEVFDLISKFDLKDKVESIGDLFSDSDSLLKQDIIIVSNRDHSLKKFLKKLTSNKIIIDLQNIFDSKDFKAQYFNL